MNKNLRYLLLSFLTIMSTAIFAQKTVTFDFDNDYQKLFPTLKGVSSGSGDSYVADGDFTEATTSTPIDGVDVRVAPAEGAKTPSRIWNVSPRLRMYSGVFTVTSLEEPITKIEFTGHDTNFNLMAVPADAGTLDGKVWTGSTLVAVFAVEKNTQISKIVVTLGGGSETPDNPDAGKGLFSLMAFTKGTFTESDNQLAFDFEAEVEPVQGTGVKIPVTGKYLFDFENDLCTACRVSVTLPDETTAAAAHAVVMQEAEKEGYTDVKLEGNTLSASLENGFVGVSKTVIKSMMKQLLNIEEEVKNVTIAEFNAAAESTDVWYQLTGTVKNLKDGDLYGNFDLEDETGSVYVYGVLSEKGGEKKKFQELVAAKGIKNGDKLTIIGNRGSYKDKIEVLNAYFVSVESGSETPDPDPQSEVTTATCAEILAGTDGTVYRVTGKCVEIANTTYGNWYLEDATGKVYIYGTLDAEGNTKNFASLGIEVGDEITVEGPRKTYKETVELVDVKVIAIKKGSSSEGGLIYSWEGGADGATEVGGKATYENGETDETKYRVNYKNGEYYTICINGKKGNIDDAAGSANGGYILITLDQALQAEDNIELTGYINKNESKEASIYFQFEKGDGVNDEYIFGDACNIDAAIGGKITPHVFKVPESAAGSKSFKMSRNKAGTNIFLTKLTINRGTTGIKEIKNVQLQNNAVYNLAGQKVGNDYKGIVIVNGKKFMQK